MNIVYSYSIHFIGIVTSIPDINHQQSFRGRCTMDAITATFVAVVVMVIGMVALLLYVTKKAYSHQWNPEDHNSPQTPADQHENSPT